MKIFPCVKQYDAVDCGPASLKMIAEYYGKNCSLDKLRDRSNITRLGVSIKKIFISAFPWNECRLEHGLKTNFSKKVEYYEGMKGEAG